MVVRTSDAKAVPTVAGNYMSICLSCNRQMEFADKRCRLCTDCQKPQPSNSNDEPREWLIRKRGYYYRPDRAGYTASVDEAGRYTESEAKAEAAIEPKIMSAVHQSTVGGAPPVVLTSKDVALVIHELKCWPEYFGPIIDGRKTFEVRKNDRGFKSGHTLHLREWRPQPEGSGYYTGRETHVRVLGVYSDLPAVREGYVVMSLGNGLPAPETCEGYSQEYADKMRTALLRIQGIALEPHQQGNREAQIQNISCLASDGLLGIERPSEKAEVQRTQVCDCDVGLCCKANRRTNQYCRIQPPSSGKL